MSRNHLYAVLDSCVTAVIILPLCVLYWRGTWDLLVYFIYPSDVLLSCIICIALGQVGGYISYAVHNYLINSISKGLLFEILCRILLYFWGWMIMCHWRGTWDILDYLLSESWVNSLITYIIALIIAIPLRCVRTMAGIPVGVNSEKELNVCDTRFGKQNYPALFFDIITTQSVIATLNVVVWRGIWNILDNFLMPDDHFSSDTMSLLLGTITLLYLYLLQYPLSLVSAKLDGHLWLKILYEDSIYIVATWSVLLLWRALWDLIKLYVIPDLLIGGIVCHCTATVFLLILQAFSNVARNNIDVDGSYTEGNGIFPGEFIRLYCNKNFSQQSESDTSSPSYFRLPTVELDANSGSDEDLFKDSTQCA